MSLDEQRTTDRVAVVTGASAGVGRATAIAFGRLGWTVPQRARACDVFAHDLEERFRKSRSGPRQ